MKERRDPRAGVTLLEMLVSLALMAALAVILATSFGAIGRALNRLDPAQAAMTPLLDRMILRRWIEDMPRQATLQGTQDHLTFQTLIDDGRFAPGALVTVTLTREDDRLIATATTQDADTVARQELTLSDSATELTLSYLPTSAGGSTSWVNDWPVGPVLPDLLQITYDIDGRMTPPLTVMPARTQRYSVISLSSRVPPG